ncbi:MAG: DUF2059 domain-containing protein, partial [Gammaproteobacteria bacterium]|nr:DUF2059 domain-containing protein [Gammaproteobacteria bacterium]
MRGALFSFQGFGIMMFYTGEKVFQRIANRLEVLLQTVFCCRTVRLSILLLTVTLCACTAASVVPTTEEAKQREAEQLQLVRYSLSNLIMQDVERKVGERLAAYLISKDVPALQANALVAEELKNMMDDEHRRLLDYLVPVYRRYYTAEEIHQLLSFYRTDVARKSLRVSSQIASEVQQFVWLWNTNFENVLLENLQERVQEQGISLGP